MGIMQLWGGRDTDDEMARAKTRTLDSMKIETLVRQLKSTVRDTDAFKAVYSSIASDKTLSTAEAIEIAYKFAGARQKTKKAALASIGQERLRVSHAKAKAESAAKSRTW